MELLHDKWLVDIYLDAIEYKLDEKFIDLLLMEVIRRKIPDRAYRELRLCSTLLSRRS